MTLEAIFAESDNERVLTLLRFARPEDVVRFEVNAEASPFDEGGKTLFYRYGKLLPDSARNTLDYHCVLVHEHSARIVAFLWGRYTFALRRGGENGDDARVGETLDGAVDLRSLGPEWVLFHDEDDDLEPEDLFLRAYELAGR